MKHVQLAIIGGGPAGLSAAIAARKDGVEDILLIERDRELGGILNQCIHAGFGLHTFSQELTGPEYARRFADQVRELEIPYLLNTMVLDLSPDRVLTVTGRETGLVQIQAQAVILAMGCRERSRGALNIPGYRPAGIFSAGTAQRLVNIEGYMPGREVVILGSGDIGLIMARRMTLEGAKVLGVYEAKPTPSGLTRNLHQCLHDYDIPLHLSHTVTRVFGVDRLEAVEISKVDENMTPIPGTQSRVECDTLILSVGLIPENELAESVGVKLDPRTKGPVCDGQCMTSIDGVFSCGNALHVNDLVDFVSQNAEQAGKSAAAYSAKERRLIEITPGDGLLYAVPQRLNLNEDNSKTDLYFRVREEENNCVLHIYADGKEILKKRYAFMRPPEMENLTIDFSACELNENSRVELRLERLGKGDGVK